jgi:hypothetical protein
VPRCRPARALIVSSDDPEYAATLAGVLGDAGQPLEAEYWRSSAAVRYDELVRRHPEAFLDHAADFWLSVGGDPQRGLGLVERDPRHSHTATAHSLLRRAPGPAEGRATLQLG